jgi:HAE1 family hydrophobic/amphiphilic exporter-1
MTTLLPKGFLPLEDNGYLFVDIQLPDAASVERTEIVSQRLDAQLRALPGVANTVQVNGYSLLNGQGSNGALVIVNLENWAEQQAPELSANAILNRINGIAAQEVSAKIIAFNPPPISGLGVSAGVEMKVQQTGGGTPMDLGAAVNSMVFAANQRPEIAQAYTSFSANVPKVFVDLDREKARTLGVQVDHVFQTLQAHLGSIYVNDLNLFGKVYRVMIQADADYRDTVDDIGRLHVRTQDGQMAPLSTLIDVENVLGPVLLNRYNLFRAATVTAVPAPGFSTGDAMRALQEEALTALPPGYSYEWTGTARQQQDAGGTVIYVLLAAIVFGYLFLVAQYESWTMPLGILLSVTVALFGALAAVLATGGDVNLYTQIGMIMLIGLASKNAILIVEFAMEQRAGGASMVEAALEAARQRFRAVMMTALSFLLGVVPLLIASGAGAASQKAIGIAVFGGMLAATVIGVILVPVLYVLLQRMREAAKRGLRNPGPAA